MQIPDILKLIRVSLSLIATHFAELGENYEVQNPIAHESSKVQISSSTNF